MTDLDIEKVRRSLREEWKRQTFDAFLLGMEVLRLTGREQESYVKAAREAAGKISWLSYDHTRESFMKEAEILLTDRGLFPEGRNALRDRMYVRFMEGRIRFFERLEQKEKCPVSPIPVGEADFHNTEMAAVFAHLPLLPDEKWLKDLKISRAYEQLHMVTWFAGQLSLGKGDFARSRPNHSAQVSYQRVQSPSSLLWIAAALGENPEVVRLAGKAAEQREAYKEKCVLIRKRIPFSRIYQLALPLVEKERENKIAG